MHARNEFYRSDAIPSASVNPIETVIDALERSDGAEAVRRLLRALDTRTAAAEDVVDDFESFGRKALLPRLVMALAESMCPHCRSGVDKCMVCSGSGRGDDRSQACAACGGIGIAACDFCGGSGLMTYDAVPDSLRASVAMRRTQDAAARIVDYAGRSLPHSVSREQLSNTRKTLIKRATKLQRELAILANAAQFARAVRGSDPALRPFSGKLFRRAVAAAKIGQPTAGRLFSILGQISRAISNDESRPNSTEFERQRATWFESRSREYGRAVRHSSALFPGHRVQDP